MAMRKKGRKKSAPKENPKAAVAMNKKALWGTYKALHKQIDKAWAKIRSDIKRKAKPQTLVEDRNHLLFLLGECNYMTRECMRHVKMKK